MTSYNPLHPLQASLSLGSSGRQVLYPCQLCSATFRWQFDLLKHYATQHFYDELASQLQLEAGPPYKCIQCSVTTETEKQILIHYGLTHKAVQKILQKTVGVGGGLSGDRFVSTLFLLSDLFTIFLFPPG